MFSYGRTKISSFSKEHPGMWHIETALETVRAGDAQRLTQITASLCSRSVSWSDLVCAELCSVSEEKERKVQVIDWRVWRVCEKYFCY